MPQGFLQEEVEELANLDGIDHLIDASQDRFSLVTSYETGTPGLHSISAGLGSVVTAALNGTIRVYQPDREMALINTVKVLLRIVSAKS